MKKVCLFVFVTLIAALAAAGAMAMEAPRDVIKATTDQVLMEVKSDREALRADPAKMYNLVSELIFPHFDFPIMAQWVLGSHWKDASEATRNEFIEQFRKLLVRTYATALLEFSNQTISYPDAEDTQKGKTVLVRQSIEQTGSEPIVLGYRLHKPSEQWKVLDVAVDGVSLVKTYRASFVSIIKEGGIEGLISSLSEKNKEINQ
jgi:phospholipid transport system substrate-binding protein